MAKPLKVLMAHNYYQNSGGEDISMATEISVLKQAGHQVRLVEWQNSSISRMSRLEKLALFWQTTWNIDSNNRVYQTLKAFNADLFHGQNLFPLASPSVYNAAYRLDVPVIQHLRNFRLGCLNAYLYRQGSVCEDCIGRNPWRGLIRRCYRDSWPASASLWQMVTTHRWRRTWQHDVNAFITPSHFSANKLIEIGVPEDKLYIKPNFIADPICTEDEIAPHPQRPLFVFAGRLSEEKGVLLLLKAWCLVKEPDWQLVILGDGPDRLKLEQFCQEKQLENVSFIGRLTHDQVLKRFQTASLILVPSLWYETFGRVVIEAFACGRAAMVSDLGALAELVDENTTGCKVPPGNERAWAARLQWCGNHLNELKQWGNTARSIYKHFFTPEVNYKQLMEIYTGVLRG